MVTLSTILERIKNNEDLADLPLARCQELLKNFVVQQFNIKYGTSLPEGTHAETVFNDDSAFIIRPKGNLIHENLRKVSSIEELLTDKITIDVAKQDKGLSGISVRNHQTYQSVYYDKLFIVIDNPDKKIALPHPGKQLPIPTPEEQALIRKMLGKKNGKYASLGMYWMKDAEVAPWLEGQDLIAFLGKDEHKQLKRENEVQLKQMGLDIAIQGLQIHHAGYLHRDFKPENVIRHDATVTLIDYRFLCKKGSASTRAGTIYYMPIQSLIHQNIPFQDIYSVAILIAMLVLPELITELNRSLQEVKKQLEKTTNDKKAQKEKLKLVQEKINDRSNDSYAKTWTAYQKELEESKIKQQAWSDSTVRYAKALREVMSDYLQKFSTPLNQILKKCFTPDIMVYHTMSDFIMALVNADKDLVKYVRQKTNANDKTSIEDVIKTLASGLPSVESPKQKSPPPGVGFSYADKLACNAEIKDEGSLKKVELSHNDCNQQILTK